MDTITTPRLLLYGYPPIIILKAELRQESEVKKKVDVTAKSVKNNGQEKVKAGSVIKEETLITA